MQLQLQEQERLKKSEIEETHVLFVFVASFLFEGGVVFFFFVLPLAFLDATTTRLLFRVATGGGGLEEEEEDDDDELGMIDLVTK